MKAIFQRLTRLRGLRYEGFWVTISLKTLVLLLITWIKRYILLNKEREINKVSLLKTRKGSKQKFFAKKFWFFRTFSDFRIRMQTI
jgi:hypothetical protein